MYKLKNLCKSQNKKSHMQIYVDIQYDITTFWNSLLLFDITTRNAGNILSQLPNITENCITYSFSSEISAAGFAPHSFWADIGHIYFSSTHMLLFQPTEPTVAQKQAEDHFNWYLLPQCICDNRFFCYLHRGLCSQISGISGFTRGITHCTWFTVGPNR